MGRSDLKSRLYWCRVKHARRFPKQHRFEHGIFMFWLDLDELPLLSESSGLLSVNRPGLYSFYDEDHLPAATGTIRTKVEAVVSHHGITLPKDSRIWLLTNLRTFGYLFNPVSFFFCETSHGTPICALSEVGNTFGEKKVYFLGEADVATGSYRAKLQKEYYISPFTALDGVLDFRAKKPEERLAIAVDTYRNEELEVASVITGHPAPLTDSNLLWATLRCPLVTLKIISLIHWHAFRLFLKKIPFHRKEENPHLQRGVSLPHHSLQTNEPQKIWSQIPRPNS